MNGACQAGAEPVRSDIDEEPFDTLPIVTLEVSKFPDLQAPPPAMVTTTGAWSEAIPFGGPSRK